MLTRPAILKKACRWTAIAEAHAGNSYLVAAAGRGNEQSCVDGRPEAHHEEELGEDGVDLYSILNAEPGQLLQKVHVPVRRLIGAQQQRIACICGNCIELNV